MELSLKNFLIGLTIVSVFIVLDSFEMGKILKYGLLVAVISKPVSSTIMKHHHRVKALELANQSKNS